MAKDLRIGSEGRAKLKAGIDTLANTVKVTLGPKGRNVILDKKFGPPQVCSDGVTIAKEIDLEDPFENMGAQLIKEASKKTNDDAGDGTTTSTVLSQAIVGEGFKNVAAGADPMAIKKGLELGLESVRKSITKLSTPVEGKEQIAQVATLSAHDDEMGSLIANVMEKTGKDGVITVDGNDNSTVGIGTTFLDAVYMVHAVSNNGNKGRITCNIHSDTNIVGIATTGIYLSNDPDATISAGKLSWGRLYNAIDGVTRTNPISIGVTGLTIDSGLSTFPTIQRKHYSQASLRGLRSSGAIRVFGL